MVFQDGKTLYSHHIDSINYTLAKGKERHFGILLPDIL